MPSSRWPTVKELSDISGDSLSHNVVRVFFFSPIDLWGYMLAFSFVFMGFLCVQIYVSLRLYMFLVLFSEALLLLFVLSCSNLLVFFNLIINLLLFL